MSQKNWLSKSHESNFAQDIADASKDIGDIGNCNYEANPRYRTFANSWSTPCREHSTSLCLCTVSLLRLVHETWGTIYILQLMVALLC